jgi:predicted small lipoprotein YifL
MLRSFLFSRREAVRPIFRAGSLMVLIALTLSACGQKGPLYLPPPDEDQKQQR